MCYFSVGREVGQCCCKWRVPGKVCRLCNHSAAALWVWGAQDSSCVLSNSVRQIVCALLGCTVPARVMTASPQKPSFFNLLHCRNTAERAQKIAEALALKHAGPPALPHGGEGQYSPALY